jgi:hypothetical protein
MRSEKHVVDMEGRKVHIGICWERRRKKKLEDYHDGQYENKIAV